MKAKFFRTPQDFRKWLERNHAKVKELWVGYYKKDSGKASITWPESVDEALCYGWIDGIRKSIDDKSYMNRFTPRRPDSIWSDINTKRVAELKKQGRMTPAGLAAFSLRDPKRSGRYSFENVPASFDGELERKFQARKDAWKFFEKQPPSFRRKSVFWVMSANQPETRARRLAKLIESSEQGVRLGVISGGAEKT